MKEHQTVMRGIVAVIFALIGGFVFEGLENPTAFIEVLLFIIVGLLIYGNLDS